MGNRHREALDIQKGSCDVLDIVKAIKRACKEVREEQDPMDRNQMGDAAVRLMVHQLAFVTGVHDIKTLADYTALHQVCVEYAPGECYMPRNPFRQAHEGWRGKSLPT